MILITGKENSLKDFSTGGPEFMALLLEEMSQKTCLEDAAFILRSKNIKPDASTLNVVAAMLREERKKKLELHRQWQKTYQGLRDELFKRNQ